MTKDIEVKKEDWFEPKGELMVDVWENEDEIVIEAPVAGVEKDSLEIVIKDSILNIQGKRQNTSQEEDKDYLLTECYWGAFSKEISLPQEIDKENIKANVEDSILIVRLPKKEAKTKEGQKIEIK